MPNLLALPRGIRNNNPGNIRHSSQAWQGQSADQHDPEFVTFTDPAHGIRAIMKLMETYYNKYCLITIKMLITRYAPPTENDTASYIADVAKRAGIGAEDVIDDIATVLIPLAEATSIHENGIPPQDYPPYWYSEETYQEAKKLALS